MARFALEAPSIPAGNDVATIVPGARLRQPTSRAPKLVTLAMSVPGSGKPKNKIAPTVNGPSVRAGSGTSAYTYATPAAAGKTAGPTGPWSGVLGKLAVRVQDGHKHDDANRAYVYEVFADVYHAARPTAAIVLDPEPPITTTSYPEIGAELTALVEDWQDDGGEAARTEIAYEVKLFTPAQYNAAGFDPATSTPFWGTQGISASLDYVDGSTPSTESVGETPETPLPNSAYRAYARGRRYFAAAQWGAWATLDFTVGVTPPNDPTISAALDDANQRVGLTVTPVATAGFDAPLYTVERSVDGETWEAVRGAAKALGAFGTPAAFYDYEAPRGVALFYRAQVEATVTASPVQLVSAWKLVGVSGHLSTADWNLKAPLDPSLNLLGASVTADPDWTQNEDAATFRPVGRKYPVVVSMSLGGADGSLEISANTDAEWAAVEALRDYAGALLLESPYGWSRYIRILSRSWTEKGSPEAARRRTAFSFLEVGAP